MTQSDEAKRDAVANLAKKLEISRLAATALVNRGYFDVKSALEYINNDTILLHDPFLLPDMKVACEIIIEALRENRKICIYGDYDVDGVTATALFYTYLKEKGANIIYYIPDRKAEGYGMNIASVESLSSQNVELIITVDNGITAVDEIAHAIGLGMKVVVTDHHSCHEILPDANASVNPKIPGSEYPYAELAGVGVAFKTICAIESVICKENGENVTSAIRDLCMRYSELVAIGTVADVMPLRDENRLLCTMGLYTIDKRPSESIDALMYISALGELASANPEYYINKPREVKKRKVNASYIGFVLAPRINAAGRVTHAYDALSLLLADNKRDAFDAAYTLCSINNARKSMEGSIFDSAVKYIRERGIDKEKILVLDSNEWQHGVIGIVASRILEKYALPVVMISFEDGMMSDEPSPMDIGKGSCRSIKGFDIHAALDHCSDLFVKYGGHELAAGLTIYRKNLNEFIERINKYARENLNEEDAAIVIDVDCEASLDELTAECAESLASFEPYGNGNPQPVFRTDRMLVKRIIGLAQGKYSKILFEKDGTEISGVCFSYSPESLPVYEGEYADAVYNVELNEYKGVTSVQLNLCDIRLSEEYKASLNEKDAAIKCLLREEDARFLDETCPERREFAVVYNYVRRLNADAMAALSVRKAAFDIRTGQGVAVTPTAIKLILLAFDELELLKVSELSEDIYEVLIPTETKKADLSASKLLDRYRIACENNKQ